jgi:hypothetical protein
MLQATFKSDFCLFIMHTAIRMRLFLCIFFFPIGLIAQVHKISGIPVVYGVSAVSIPVQWRKEPVRGNATSLSLSQVEPFWGVMEGVFKKYPDYLLKENLAGVHLVGELSFYGRNFPGTYMHDRIWISLTGDPLWDHAFLEGVFHREMSSILLNNYSRYFNYLEWENLYPRRLDPKAIMQYHPDSIYLGIDPDLVKEGFLNTWATTSLENDFNAISARLFGGERLFWQLTDQHALLRKKVLLAIQFYHSLDKRFTEAYFKGMAQ